MPKSKVDQFLPIKQTFKVKISIIVVYVQEGLSFFLSKSGISVIEDEPNCRKEITFTGTISTDNDIVTGTERLNCHLVLVRFESLNCELKTNN